MEQEKKHEPRSYVCFVLTANGKDEGEIHLTAEECEKHLGFTPKQGTAYYMNITAFDPETEEVVEIYPNEIEK